MASAFLLLETTEPKEHASTDEVLQTLLDEAQRLKTAPFRTVMDKALVPPSGDKHDYMSFGPYWWPNPETLDGLPYVRRDGLLNPDTAESDRKSLEETMRAVEVLALTYFYSGDEPLAQAAAQRLRAWFVDEATRMNPHLQYGQAIPGVCEGRGIGIIDTVQLRLLPDIVTILEGSVSWSQRDSEAVRQWLGDYLAWLLTSEHGLDEERQHNNHGTWYDVQVALFALATGRGDVAERVLENVGQHRFEPQLAADGSQPHELARTRAFSYSCYNLTGFFDLAALAKLLCVDLWHWQGEGGVSLPKALEFLAAYADAEVAWPYPQVVPDDRSQLLKLLRRAQSHLPEGDWEEAIGLAEKTAKKWLFF